MAVYRRGKIWWYVFEFEGRRIQESSGCTNRTAAIRAEAKRKSELVERRAGFKRKPLPPKFRDFISVFLAWSKQQHRPKTHSLHSGNCNTLNRYFGQQWMDDITAGNVEDFKVARVEERRWGDRDEIAVSGVTVNRALSTLRLIFNYAERCGYQLFNPVKGIGFYEELGRTRIISLEEQLAYLASAGQPLKDVAQIILDTGMRPEEVFRIESANLDFSTRTIFNPFGKTRVARRKLMMTEEIFNLLKTRSSETKSQFVFPSEDDPERHIQSVRKAHNAAIRRAQIKPTFRLYDLRHTYASRAVMAGVDLPTLAALLGHTKIQMTMRYVHPAEEHKREAAAKIEDYKAQSAIRLAERSQGVPTVSTTVQ
jgi:integrase